MDACVSYGWGSGDFIKMALGESSSNNIDYVVLTLECNWKFYIFSDSLLDTVILRAKANVVQY